MREESTVVSLWRTLFVIARDIYASTVVDTMRMFFRSLYGYISSSLIYDIVVRIIKRIIYVCLSAFGSFMSNDAVKLHNVDQNDKKYLEMRSLTYKI